MKHLDWEDIALFGGLALVLIVFFWLALTGMAEKNNMCIAIGNKVYGHPLDWLQCLVL